MKCGIVNYSEMMECSYWLSKCLEIGNNYNLYHIENDFYKLGKKHLFKIQSRKTFDKNFFCDLNDWFCYFCCGISEIELIVLEPEIAQKILNFSTKFCWTIGYDTEYDDFDYFLIK